MAGGNDAAMRFRYLGRAALCLIKAEDREVVAWADALWQLRDTEAVDSLHRNRYRPVLCTCTGDGTPLRTRVRHTRAAEELTVGYRHGRRAADVLLQRLYYNVPIGTGIMAAITRLALPRPLSSGKDSLVLWYARDNVSPWLQHMGTHLSLVLHHPTKHLDAHPRPPEHAPPSPPPYPPSPPSPQHLPPRTC